QGLAQVVCVEPNTPCPAPCPARILQPYGVGDCEKRILMPRDAGRMYPDRSETCRPAAIGPRCEDTMSCGRHAARKRGPDVPTAVVFCPNPAVSQSWRGKLPHDDANSESMERYRICGTAPCRMKGYYHFSGSCRIVPSSASASVNVPFRY